MESSDAAQALLNALASRPELDQERIRAALALAEHAHQGQQRSDGTPYVLHPIAMTQILVEWNADTETICAGLLHDVVEDTPVPLERIERQFGEEIAYLVDGVTKFTRADFEEQESLHEKTETLRKLFEMMQRDIRVAIVKLADRLHNVRTIEALPKDRRIRFAKDTITVYYKLTEHLGMNEVRRELSNRCLPILQPQDTAELLREQADMTHQAELIAEEFRSAVQSHDRSGALVEMRLRPHSLSNLIEKRRYEGDELPYVCVAIAKDRDGCYELLKLFHTLYRPISGRFRDYIAVPQENAYQTIRTSVLSPEGIIVPIRIRTLQMDEQERRGVLLKAFGKDQNIPGFSWLERYAEANRSTRKSSEEFWQVLQSDILQQQVHVTANGKDVLVPAGATALDAVYSIEGEAANHTKHLMVNGKTANRAHVLSEDDVVAYKLGSDPLVQHSWLQDVSTQYSRSCMVGALKERDWNEKLVIGQQLLQKELDNFRLGILGQLSRNQKKHLAKSFGRSTFEEVVALVGEGTLRARDVALHITPNAPKRLLKRMQTWQKPYRFHLRVFSNRSQDKNALAELLALSRVHDITISKTAVRRSRHNQSSVLSLKGNALSQLDFADFVSSIEKQEWISRVQTLISPLQKFTLGFSFIIAFGVLVTSLLLLPSYQELINDLAPSVIHIYLIPFLPVVAANYALLRLLRRYILRMRNERWLLGTGFVLNGITVSIIYRQVMLEFQHVQHFTLILLIILCLLFLGYTLILTGAFIQTRPRLEPLTD